MDSHCLCHIRDIYQALIHFESDLQHVAGVNLNEAMLLCLLTQEECLLAGEIADRLHLTRSNTSKVIASLEAKGLVVRERCEHDSRCQRFRITSQGEKMMEQVHCDAVQVPPILQRLGEETAR